MTRAPIPSLPAGAARRALVGAVALLAAALFLSAALPAAAGAAPSRAVEFDGRTVAVPKGWSVYRLAENPRMCVRLDRRAVYLGTPSPNQRCAAAGAVGRQRAILVEPRDAEPRGPALPRIPRAGASAAKATASAGGAIFTGLGFDACTAPSSSAMAAWAKSPYRAVGVYIGGLNRACSQPALTSNWVASQTAAGWYLIPTYVGLQAPTSSCTSCAKLTVNGATAQGEAAAVDAVAQATELGMGQGSPIYNDMESYSQTSSATAATLAFLEAWTVKLHSLGYLSGVYSSSSSGIEDLADQVGTGYVLPDALWIANWNGEQNTADPAVPANAWANQQRIHQYLGGHNETWGGVTINIDSNYVDGPTVGLGGTLVTPGDDDPIGALDLTASPKPGHLRVKGWAFDPNSPSTTLGIRVTIGGRAGSPGVATHELGEVASLGRRDIVRENPEAGPRHGFDVTLPVIKSGPQPVCVYALDFDPGDDRLLACRATKIGVPVTFANVTPTPSGVRLRLACTWPAGAECPGRLMLRTRVKIAQRRGAGKPPRIRVLTRSLGRSSFRLSGEGSLTVKVPYSAGGKRLLRQRGKLRTQLIAAIPGGRRVQILNLQASR